MRDTRDLRFALWGVRARPARTLAMVLSLAASVACVVFTSSVLAGFTREIERMAFGDYPRTLIIRRNTLVDGQAGPPSLNDRAWLLSELRNVEASAAWAQGLASVRGPAETRNFAVFGATGDYRRELDARLIEGRWLGEIETAGLGRVCLIGPELADFLGRKDLLGREIALNNIRCRVIGVYGYAESRPAARFNTAAIAPFGAARRYFINQDPSASFGPREADWLSFFMRPRADMDDVRYQADRLLRRRAGVPLSRASPYQYDDPAAAIRDQVRQRDALARLLWTVTATAMGTSLIGYGSIAFASTASRRREVAIRLAMGGAPKQVLRQFTLEHLIIGLLASTLGLLAGVSGALLASAIWKWPVMLSVPPALLAVVFGCVVGWGFGTIAARRAAATSPALAARD